MSTKEPTSRRFDHAKRSTLLTLGAAALAELLPLGASQAGSETDAETILFTGLDRRRLARMGEPLLAAIGEPDRPTLVAQALADVGLDAGAVSGVERAAIVKRRADAIHDDFDRGRTIKFRGWVLAQTEVRLAALAARSAD